MKSRREILGKGAHACLGAAALGAVGGSNALPAEEKVAPQKFLLVGLCGSENPTRANFPFVWAAALYFVFGLVTFVWIQRDPIALSLPPLVSTLLFGDVMCIALVMIALIALLV